MRYTVMALTRADVRFWDGSTNYETQWYDGTDRAEAISAMAGAAVHERTISVTLVIDNGEDQ